MPLTKVQPEMMQQLTPAIMPTGSVIQTVQFVCSNQTSTSNSSFTATNLTATITPTSATSKIYISVSSTCTVLYGPQQGQYTIYRNNTTNLGSGASSAFNVNQPSGSGTYNWVPLVINYLDSPATTSATTYTLYIAATGGATVYANWSSYASTITLQEIHG